MDKIINMTWKRESSTNFIAKMFIFLVCPFFAWLLSLLDPREKSSYTIFFLFSLLLLWHMTPTGMTEGYHDFLGILEVFNRTNITTAQFFDEVIAFFSFSFDAPKELYQDFLIWVTKSFTENYHFMFLLAAIPVAYFQLKSLMLVTNDGLFVPGFYGIVVLIMMILPRDIIGVQNPRFTTGFWLFVFCSLYAFSYNRVRLRYLLPLLLLPIFHSGLWPALLVTIIFIAIPKKVNILEIVAIASIPFLFIDSNFLSIFSIEFDFLPYSLALWVEDYTSAEAYAALVQNEGRAGFWWVTSIFDIGKKIIYIVMAIQVIKSRKHLDKYSEAYNFYPFFLFIFFFINLIQFIPEMGTRYFGMWRIFVFYIWYKTFHFSKKKILLLLFAFNSWYIINRYGYILGGALAINMPPDVFIMPLPYLMGKGLFW